jgi:uncharacterized protein YidB (DUF937 family)
MGLLDQVIRSALGSSGAGSGRSQIAMALMALLASRAMAGRSGAQNPGGIGGLGGLLARFREGGYEDIINSWIGTGPNKPISPNQLHEALGPDTVEDLSRETGIPHQDLLSQLSEILPGIVDKLTPQGRLPPENEMLPGPRAADEH